MRTWGIAGFASEVDSKCLRACKSELLEEESGGCGSCVGVPIELLVGLSCALPRRISEGKNTRESWMETGEAVHIGSLLVCRAKLKRRVGLVVEEESTHHRSH